MIQLFDGRVFRWGQEGKDQSRWQMVEFKTYRLPLQLFSFPLKGGKSETEMSLGELWATLSKEPRGSDPYNRAMVELNQRFAMPVGALILCLIAMPLGLSHRQQGRTWGLIVGLAIFPGVLYRLHRVLAPGPQLQAGPRPGALDLQFPVYLGGPVSVVPHRAGTAVAAGKPELAALAASDLKRRLEAPGPGYPTFSTGTEKTLTALVLPFSRTAPCGTTSMCWSKPRRVFSSIKMGCPTTLVCASRRAARLTVSPTQV